MRKIVPRIRLKQVRDGSVKFAVDRVNRPADVYRAVRSYYQGADREILTVLCLDAQSVPTCLSVVAVGGLNTTRARPADFFKPAILSNALGMVAIHNHPSGVLEASPEDIDFSQTLKTACELMGLELFDHLVVTDDGYISLREAGHI
jgi:DNA repair protein RadC